MKRLSTALVLVSAWAASPIGDHRAAGAEVAYVTDDQRDVVSVLDTATRSITDTIPVGPGIRPCGIALSPDGRTAYAANPSPDTVSVIDLATRTTSSIALRCPTDACQPRGVIVSPDGHFLYAVSEEFDREEARVAITEIDAPAHAVTRTFTVPADGVSGGCLAGAITADGRLLYVPVVSTSGTPVVSPFALSVIDTATGGELTRLASPPLRAVVALPSGEALAAATPGGLAIINATTQAIERVIPIAGDVGLIAVNPDGVTAYVLGSCLVNVVDLARGIVRTTIPLGPLCSAWDMAVTPDGAHLLVAEITGPSIIEIDTATNALTKTLVLNQEIGSLAVASDSNTLYVANGTPGIVVANRSFDRAGALLRVDLRSDAVTSLFPPAGPSAVAATPDGNQLYVANSLSDEVVVVDARLNRVQARIQIPAPSSLAVESTGHRIFVGSAAGDSGRVTVIDRQATAIASSVALDGPVSALAVAPDGRRLYAATRRGETTAIAVLDVATLTRVATIPADTSLTALVFAPDGGALYAAQSHYALNEVTGGVATIDPAAERFQAAVETRGGVPGLAVSPDGQTLYAPTWICCLDERPPELSVIDAVRQTLRTTAPIDGAGRIAITATGDALYVASGRYSGLVTVIDTSTLTATGTVTVGVSTSDVTIASAPADPTCIGDCNGDGVVNIAELTTLVTVALNGENADSPSCPATSEWCADGVVAIDCLVKSVGSALDGCLGIGRR